MLNFDPEAHMECTKKISRYQKEEARKMVVEKRYKREESSIQSK